MQPTQPTNQRWSRAGLAGRWVGPIITCHLLPFTSTVAFSLLLLLTSIGMLHSFVTFAFALTLVGQCTETKTIFCTRLQEIGLFNMASHGGWLTWPFKELQLLVLLCWLHFSASDIAARAGRCHFCIHCPWWTILRWDRNKMSRLRLSHHWLSNYIHNPCSFLGLEIRYCFCVSIFQPLYSLRESFWSALVYVLRIFPK